MSSKLVPCPECIAQVRKDHLDSHIKRVHRSAGKAQRRFGKSTRQENNQYYNNQSYYLSPQYFGEWDRGYNSERYNSDAQSVASGDWWSDTQGYPRPRAYTPKRDIWSPTTSNYSRRSSVVSVSDVSDTASIATTNTEDSRPHSSNKNPEMVIFSTPSSVVTQKRSISGYSCPVPGCLKKFTEIDEVIVHAKTKHQLERCPHCRDINFKFSHKLKDHIQQNHPITPIVNTENRSVAHNLRSRPFEGSSLSVSVTTPVKRPPSSKTSKIQANTVGKSQTTTTTTTTKTTTTTTNNHMTSKDSNKPARKSICKSPADNPKQSISKKIQNTSVVSNKQEKVPGQNLSQTGSTLNRAESPQVPITAVIKQIHFNNGEESTHSNKASRISSPFITRDRSTSPAGFNSRNQQIDNKIGNIIPTDLSQTLLTDTIGATYVQSPSPTQDVDEMFFPDSFRDIELDNDPNFRYVNTGGLIGYSLNILPV